MNSLVPTLYLLLLCVSLSILIFFLFTQITRKKEIETELFELQNKIRSGEATPNDYYSLGVIYLSKRLFDQAILQFSKSLKSWDKKDFDGLANLYNTIGFTYFESGQYDVSIYYYKEAITLDPQYIVALNNLAYAYEKKKMLEQAIDIYSKVLMYDQTNVVASEKLVYLRKRFKHRDDRI